MASAFFLGSSLGRFGPLLRLFDDPVDLFRRKTAHLHQIVGLDHRQVIVRQEALSHQAVGQLLVEPLDFREPGQRAVELLFQLLAGHDLDVPATQFAGQSNILPPPPDGQRKLILRDQHDGPAQHLAEDHFVHFGRLQGVGDQQLHVLVPTNDIDPFAGQLVDDILDSVAPNTNARAHAINPLIRAIDSDLGAIAGFPGTRLDLDHPVRDFGDFLFEEPLDQAGTSAAQDDLHPRALLAHVAHGGPNPLVVVVGLAGNLFASGEDRLGVAEGNDRHSAVVSLDHPGHQLFHLVQVFQVQRVSLGLADFLDHHLLGGLGTDSLRHLGGVQRHTVMRSQDRAILAVNLDFDFLVFAVVFLGGRDQRRFDPLEDDFLVDVFVPVDRVNDPQHFARIHRSYLSHRQALAASPHVPALPKKSAPAASTSVAR